MVNGVEKDKKKITFVYPDDFKTKYINGAFGGFNNKGDFVMNLFYDNIPIPTGSSLEISDDKVIETFDGTEPIKRYVETSVAMNLETAKSIRDWLTRNINQIEKDMN